MAYCGVLALVVIPAAAKADPRLPLRSVGFVTALAASLIGWTAAVLGAHRCIIVVGYVISVFILMELSPDEWCMSR